MQVNKKTNTKRSGILMVAVAVMLCATLITGHVISGTFAKYVSKGQPASDRARVASFSVAANGDDSELSLDYGGTATYTITLKNASEVALNSTVSITFLSNVRYYMDASINDSVTDTPGELSADGKTFTWENICSLEPAQTEVTLTLTLTTVEALPSQLSGVSSESYSGSFPFEASVDFVQID